jgi:hypothetical protein
MNTSATSPADIMWRKSSKSTGQNDCVEIARTGTAVLIRDSKNRGGGHLAVSARTWASLITSIKHGGLA